MYKFKLSQNFTSSTVGIMNPAPEYDMVLGLLDFPEYKWRDKSLKNVTLQTPLKEMLDRGEVCNSNSERVKDESPKLQRKTTSEQ